MDDNMGSKRLFEMRNLGAVEKYVRIKMHLASYNGLRIHNSRLVSQQVKPNLRHKLILCFHGN